MPCKGAIMKTLYAVTEAQFGQIQKINAFFTEKERELRAKGRTCALHDSTAIRGTL